MKRRCSDLGRAALWVFCTPALAVLLSSCKPAADPQGDAGPPPVLQTPGGEMVLVPGGSFEMGSAHSDEEDESPHRVWVSPFYMDRHEVTQEEYRRVMGANPSRWKGDANPVEQIRWANAAAYCNARSHLEGLRPAYDPKSWQCDPKADGYRLPTEAEFECAARAGTAGTYSFGDDPGKLKEHAWYKDNCPLRRPHPVGQKEPNPWGLYDIYGNVWEWCNDYYGEDYYRHSPQRDPQGPAAGKTRVLRGGSWHSGAEQCRSDYRSFEDPAYRDVCFGKEIHGLIGFRCVRSWVASAQKDQAPAGESEATAARRPQ